MYHKKRALFISVLLSFFFTACGSSSSASSSSNESIAYLIDKKVEGIEYYCDNNSASSAYTLEDGSFKYTNNCNIITFKIGAITIATMEVSTINDDKKVYITDLVGTQRINTQNDGVVNIARVLQTLDEDMNPQNGIKITSTIRNNILFTSNYELKNPLMKNDTDLQYIIDDAYTNRKLISKTKALVHLEETLKEDGFFVDTVAPYVPYLNTTILGTTNTKTPIKLNGEKNTKIYLNNINQNLSLDENGFKEIFLLIDTLQDSNKSNFLITLVDDEGKVSEVLDLNLIHDTQTPIFNVDINKTINHTDANTTSGFLALTMDTSNTSNQLGFDYEISGTDKDMFEINSLSQLLFKNVPTATQTYNITIKATEKDTYNPHSASVSITINVN